MLHFVIMAGGAGTRFWPESRAARPKQLLPLAGTRTMLQMTVDRLGDLAAAKNVWILTGAGIVDAVRTRDTATAARKCHGRTLQARYSAVHRTCCPVAKS